MHGSPAFVACGWLLSAYDALLVGAPACLLALGCAVGFSREACVCRRVLFWRHCAGPPPPVLCARKQGLPPAIHAAHAFHQGWLCSVVCDHIVLCVALTAPHWSGRVLGTCQVRHWLVAGGSTGPKACRLQPTTAVLCLSCDCQLAASEAALLCAVQPNRNPCQ